MPRFMRTRRHRRGVLVYAPHEKLALLLSRFGNWTGQPELVEARALDVLVAYANRVPSDGTPEPVTTEQARKNYKLLLGPCARLCDATVERRVDLLDPIKVGCFVELFVPRVS